jgi:hypothetical protein
MFRVKTWGRAFHTLSHVFREGGTVVKVAKLDYSAHLAKPNLQSVLLRVMKAHHVKILRKLERGRMDSIPPAIIMRPTTSEEDSRLFVESSLPQNPAPVVALKAPSSIPSSVRASNEAEKAPTSAALVWDRIVAEAQHAKLAEPPSRRQDHLPPPSTDWQKVTHTRLRERFEADPDTLDAARVAYQEGISALRNDDASLALRRLAKAVELEPENRRFRTALRRALDFADEQE